MYSGCLAASEFILRKINSGVWFVQTFYGKCIPFYRKSIPMFGSVKHFTKNGICFFTKNQFSCLVCGSFYGKYEMPYKFKHLHYLDKPVTIQN